VLLAAIVAALIGGGFAAAQWRSASVAAPVLQKRFGPGVVSGQVVRVESRSRGPRILLDRVVLSRTSPEATPGRVRIVVKRSEKVRVGDRISVLAKLSPPSAPAAPGAYDFQRRVWFERLGATGFALGPVGHGADIAPGKDVGRAALWIAGLRQTMSERIRTALPGATGAVAAALIVGDRSAIPKDVVEAMRESGLAHLLAISGLHMGLVAATLFFGLRGILALVEPLALRYPIKKWAAAAAILGSLGYLLIAGATVPTQRAFAMTGLMLFAVILDRTAISLRLVAWAAMIILALAPEALLGASFQMSFGAVVALVATYEALRGPISTHLAGGGFRRRIALYFATLALTSVIAGLATGAIALYHFGRIAHFGLAANLVAVPLTGLWIMPWAVIACALMPFGLESLALTPMSWGLEVVIATAGKVASWPGAVTHVPAMPGFGLILVALGGLWLCLWRGRWRWGGMAALLAGLLTIPLAPRPDILISDTGRLMAVRLADGGLGLSSRRVERFTAERWLRADGSIEPRSWLSRKGRGGPLKCDSLGCIYRRGKETVALLWDGRAIAEDCRTASVVISAVPVRRRCPAAHTVIDRFDLWRNGAHALYFEPAGPRVVSVTDARGVRPWTPRRKRWKRRRN